MPKAKPKSSEAQPSPEGGAWLLRLCGGVRLERNGERIERFATKRSALILARLALSRYRQSSRDDLADALWPDDFPDATRIRLRQELSRLRDALGDAASIIDADRTWVRIKESEVDCDVWAFERLFLRGRSAESPQERVAALEEAMAWIQGTLAPETSEPWILGERDALNRKLTQAAVAYSEALVAIGQPLRAIEVVEQLARKEPMNEEVFAAYIWALRANGAAAEAKRVYLEFEARVTRQLGTEPSDRLRRAALSTMDVPSASSVEEFEQAFESPEERQEGPVAWPALPRPDRTWGRSVEQQVLKMWLASQSPVRLVTLTGPGGVGKTHLSLALGEALEEDYGSRRAIVELASEDESSLAHAFARALRIPFESSAVFDVIRGVGDEPALIIVDNAEHVIDEVREVVKTMLGALPNLKLIVTSRRRLELPDEREFPLAPLPIPEIHADAEAFEGVPSVAMFLDHVHRFRRDYAVDEESRPFLAMLLRRLEGLPLAVRMAAQQADIFSLKEIFEGLDDSFTQLVLRDSTAARRHISLRNTYDWSFKLLDPDRQEALMTLALFPGGWTLPIAQKILDREDAIDLIRGLVAMSLVRAHDSDLGTRYTMLETVRTFALEDVAPDRLHQMQARKAQVLAEWAQENVRYLTSMEQDEWYRRFEEEQSNLIAAMDWALEHDHVLCSLLVACTWRFLQGRGDSKIGFARAKALFERADLPLNTVTGRSQFAVGALGRTIGENEIVERGFLKSYETYKVSEEPHMACWPLYNLGTFLFDKRRFHEAIRYCREAIEIIDAHWPEDERLMAGSIPRACEAISLAYLGQTEEAIEKMEPVFGVRVQDGEPTSVGRAYGDLAIVYACAGKLEVALPLFRTGVKHLREADVRYFFIMALLQLAEFTADDEERLATIAECESLCRRSGMDFYLSEALALKGCFTPEKSDSTEAFAEAMELAQKLPDSAVFRILTYVAKRLERDGERSRAKAIVELVDRERKSLRIGVTLPEAKVMEQLRTALADCDEPTDWTMLLRALPWNAAPSMLLSFFKVEQK